MVKLLISIFFTFIVVVQPAVAESPTEESCERVTLNASADTDVPATNQNPVHNHDCHHCPNSSHTCHIGHCAFPISAQVELSFSMIDKCAHLLSNSLIKLSDFSSNLFRPPIV